MKTDASVHGHYSLQYSYSVNCVIFLKLTLNLAMKHNLLKMDSQLSEFSVNEIQPLKEMPSKKDQLLFQ